MKLVDFNETRRGLDEAATLSPRSTFYMRGNFFLANFFCWMILTAEFLCFYK